VLPIFAELVKFTLEVPLLTPNDILEIESEENWQALMVFQPIVEAKVRVQLVVTVDWILISPALFLD
jgi:hypothetical protein